jgi:hypothetical protein
MLTFLSIMYGRQGSRICIYLRRIRIQYFQRKLDPDSLAHMDALLQVLWIRNVFFWVLIPLSRLWIVGVVHHKTAARLFKHFQDLKS